PRFRPVDGTAMPPERRTDRTDARAARALLSPELATRAADFALFFYFVRSRRSPRRYHREASCSRCGFTFAPKTASASSTWPTFLPSRLTTSTTGMFLVLLSL